MQINIPRIVRPVRLSDYAPEYGEQVIWMWVNPPRELRLEFQNAALELDQVRDSLRQMAPDEADPDIVAQHVKRVEELGQELYAWYAHIWSQHEDETSHFTADEVQELAALCLDSDPALWEFIQERALGLLKEHREGQKKM